MIANTLSRSSFASGTRNLLELAHLAKRKVALLHDLQQDLRQLLQQ